MPSLRHNAPAGTASARDDHLDAARACILDVGWRRTTLTEVARRAGVSRMTIYRTWSDMAQLLGDLMTREWGSVVARTTLTQDVASSRGLAAALVSVVRALRHNELFVRIVELDPELLLPYLFDRRGRSQQALVELVADAITTGQATGRIRHGHPETMARSLVLAAHGFVLSAGTMVDGEVDGGVSLADLDGELRLLVECSLAP